MPRAAMTRGSAAEFGVPTPRGPAEVVLEWRSRRGVGLLVLGHGAGGDVTAPDLVAVRDAALRTGFVVARVTQPYRVAGRRTPPPAATLDEAWLAVIPPIRQRVGAHLPLVVGGRSSGARVACRTARAVGAAGVLALAFPVHPPGRPDRSRLDELDPGLPTLVINGDRDPFGLPEPAGLIQVVLRAGEGHDLRRDPDAVGDVAAAWLRDLPAVTSLKRTNQA
jgi:predicted alpha/beta-hydrolase family hydrolase